MNNKITLPLLAALLSDKSGVAKKQCEEYLKEFFNLLSSLLCEGENVKIKGFGTFKVVSVENRRSVDVSTGEDITIPGHNKIVFVPARELAEEINSPFAMFDSVELNPEVEIDMESDLPETTTDGTPENVFVLVDTSEEREEQINDETPEAEKQAEVEMAEELEIDEAPEVVEESAQDPESVPKIELEQEEGSTQTLDEEGTAKGEEFEATIEIEAEEQEAEEVLTEEQETEEVPSEGPKRKKSYKFFWGVITGVAVVLILDVVCLFFLGDQNPFGLLLNRSETAEEQVEETVISDSSVNQQAESPKIAVVDSTESPVATVDESEYPKTQPSDEKVYDTIGDRRYLTTMAQDHYGNFNLWPYIYEENKSFLGHPDRIKPGTKVVIPPLSKYGVDPKNPADIKKAKAKGVEIYGRYNKKL